MALADPEPLRSRGDGGVARASGACGAHSAHSARGPAQDGRKIQYILYEGGCYLPNPEPMWWIDRNEFLAALENAELAHRGGHAQQATNAYQQAVSLYRGPLLEDDSAGDWYLPEQRRLKELYLRALERLTEINLGLGDLAAAIQ
ncbi:MAG TPA: BTAD domain-containing putative transcriptional regulator [Trebonia sp.]